jgi:tRNA A37 threonylcarbamoyladenosine dehydratase
MDFPGILGRYCNDRRNELQYTSAYRKNETSMPSKDYFQRFSGLTRIYGSDALEHLSRARFCIVGIGGVGSWAAEAAARSGIGYLTIIDHDDIELSNTNRQIHALQTSLGRSKVHELADRIKLINPECQCNAIDDLVTRANLEQFNFHQFDYVIDAIDQVQHKMSLVHYLRRNKIKLVVTGGAGGLTDPSKIEITDLTRTYNDPLLAMLRSKLRHQLDYSRNPKRRYGIDCVFSSQQPVYSSPEGIISHAKPGYENPTTLDCNTGLGSFVGVTASFGLTAVSHALNKYMSNRQDEDITVIKRA